MNGLCKLGLGLVGGSNSPVEPMNIYHFEDNLEDSGGDDDLENLLTGVPSYAPGIRGKALICGTDNAVRYPDSGSFKIHDGTSLVPFSIVCWAATDEPTVERQTVVMVNNVPNALLTMGFKVSSSVLYPVMVIRGVDYVNASVQLDTWIHMAITYDGTTFKHYINGAVAKTATGVLTDGVDPRMVSVGAASNGASQLHGEVDELSFYDVALSDAAIKKMYDVEAPLAGQVMNGFNFVIDGTSKVIN